MIADDVLKRLVSADLTGEKLTGLLTGMAVSMNLSDAAQANLILGYVENWRDIKPGDFIPTITLSLTRYIGVENDSNLS